ncbi:2-oxoglutarate dehydrogenase E1 component [Angomonas deanei]|nr:2-oxoglutarate dehydrogenase E1 component [Angomonas deanei]|eukprot:EPY32855.1 2-oxoglutarate dehydrogenase E1 component [Angomonas deanei]
MMRRAIQPAVVALHCKRPYTDAKTIRKPNPYDQILNPINQTYIENMIRQYEEDHALIDASWGPVMDAIRSPNMDIPVVSTFSRPFDPKSLSEQQRLDNMRLSWMIREYERSGHFFAKTNPLNSVRENIANFDDDLLDPATFGFSASDLQQVFNVTFGANYEATFVSGGTAMTLQQIFDRLGKMYCGPIGYEFMSSGFFELRNWFRQEILNTLQPLTAEDKKGIYTDVVKACGLEKFLQIKYATQQRFGLDGGESFIPVMNSAIMEATANGCRSVIIGMAHRGRLNCLANVCHMSLHSILNQFEENVEEHMKDKNGDVKYHINVRNNVKLPNGKMCDIEMLPNPSHLEAVNPLVLGKARARQIYQNDVEGTGVMPILVHGDAAFVGQGPCYETMGFCDLENFHCGGTIHIVINNQIGFTTDPYQGRASRYCTDLAKVNNAPVLHVNGDNVEACVRASRIAARFRQQFNRDIILDVVCYRRNGHNETDLPDFTQPQMYEEIRKHPTLVEIYTKQLVEEKVIPEDYRSTKEKEWEGLLRHAYDRLKSVEDFVSVQPIIYPDLKTWRGGRQGDGGPPPAGDLHPPRSRHGGGHGYPQEGGVAPHDDPTRRQKAHPVVDRTYAARKKGIVGGDEIEWCLGELLAFGTLSLQGVHVRVTGEDVERGTFTQRHAAITDQSTNLKYFPVATISPKQSRVTISNSSLSEYGVCGFEMGYNMESTKSVTMWEAQFGDFANGAQVIFDQFLCCCEQKWNVRSSLILSLPHGYSGAGPEHSSARVERFLQLSDDVDTLPSDFRAYESSDDCLEARIFRHNWQVTYPSTPANYFHLLRRQGLRDFAKPLVNFFSKARLRAPNLSKLSEMCEETKFRPVLDLGAEGVVPRKVVFCTGQIESILNDARAHAQKTTPDVNNDVILVTVEQLAPFPWEHVAEVVEKYAALNKDLELVWLQEEPKNMGMWHFMRPRFNNLIRHLNVTSTKNINFIGRAAVASPSTGYGTVHTAEEKEIISKVFA